MDFNSIFKTNLNFRFKEDGTIESLDGARYQIMFALKFVKKTGTDVLRLNIGLTPYMVRETEPTALGKREREHFKLEMIDGFDRSVDGKVINIGGDVLSVFSKQTHNSGVTLHVTVNNDGTVSAYIPIFTWLEKNNDSTKRLLAMATYNDLRNDLLHTFNLDEISPGEFFIIAKTKTSKKCIYPNLIVAFNFARKLVNEFEVL